MFEAIEKGALTLTIGPGRAGKYRATVTRDKAPWEQVMAQDHRVVVATAEADKAEKAVRLVIEESKKRMEDLNK